MQLDIDTILEDLAEQIRRAITIGCARPAAISMRPVALRDWLTLSPQFWSFLNETSSDWRN